MKGILRNIIILVVVVGLGIAGYSMFFKKDSGSATGLATTAGEGTTAESSQSATANAAVGREFLTLLLNIRSIELNESIFESKAFTNLQNFSRPLPPDPNPGRPNPFAPLGVDSAGTSTQVSTSNASSITQTASALNGTITIGGPTVTRWFQYGTTEALELRTPAKPQMSAGAFTETITGLVPNTTYYVKAVAQIGTQTVAGNLVTWKTAQAGTAR